MPNRNECTQNRKNSQGDECPRTLESINEFLMGPSNSMGSNKKQTASRTAETNLTISFVQKKPTTKEYISVTEPGKSHAWGSMWAKGQVSWSARHRRETAGGWRRSVSWPGYGWMGAHLVILLSCTLKFYRCFFS